MDSEKATMSGGIGDRSTRWIKRFGRGDVCNPPSDSKRDWKIKRRDAAKGCSRSQALIGG